MLQNVTLATNSPIIILTAIVQQTHETVLRIVSEGRWLYLNPDSNGCYSKRCGGSDKTKGSPKIRWCYCLSFADKIPIRQIKDDKIRRVLHSIFLLGKTATCTGFILF
jgi:hypothetical protein